MIDEGREGVAIEGLQVLVHHGAGAQRLVRVEAHIQFLEVSTCRRGTPYELRDTDIRLEGDRLRVLPRGSAMPPTRAGMRLVHGNEVSETSSPPALPPAASPAIPSAIATAPPPTAIQSRKLLVVITPLTLEELTELAETNQGTAPAITPAPAMPTLGSPSVGTGAFSKQAGHTTRAAAVYMTSAPEIDLLHDEHT